MLRIHTEIASNSLLYEDGYIFSKYISASDDAVRYKKPKRNTLIAKAIPKNPKISWENRSLSIPSLIGLFDIISSSPRCLDIF